MKKSRKIALIIIGVLLVLEGIAAVVFLVNRWSVDITLNGDPEVVLEYGDSYTEEGATATFHGSILFKKGWDVPVTVTGTVDVEHTGSSTVTYTAEAHRCSDTQTRTVTVRDTVQPEIILTAEPEHYTLPGQPYEEEGYTATDNYDGDITDRVTSEERDGIVYYTVSDSSGNTCEVQRTIIYDDPIPPVLTLLGDTYMTTTAGGWYDEPGYSAVDNVDGDITANVQVDGSVDIWSAGTYTITYTVSDNYGNTVSAQRVWEVQPLRQPDTVVPDGKIVYLTFDDGPGQYTRQLLDILEKYNVKATFFVVNTGYTSLIADEYAAGHSIGIHSATHNYAAIYASEDAYFADLNKMQSIIEEKTGHKTTLLRFPGGSSNQVSKKYCEGIMTKLTQDVTDLGYQYFDWNVVSGDAGDTTDTEQVYQNVINGISKHDVSVVLQHDIKGFSVDAVEKIIVWGLQNGYTFLPLDSSSPTAHQSVNN